MYVIQKLLLIGENKKEIDKIGYRKIQDKDNDCR